MRGNRFTGQVLDCNLKFYSVGSEQEAYIVIDSLNDVLKYAETSAQNGHVLFEKRDKR